MSDETTGGPYNLIYIYIYIYSDDQRSHTAQTSKHAYTGRAKHAKLQIHRVEFIVRNGNLERLSLQKEPRKAGLTPELACRLRGWKSRDWTQDGLETFGKSKQTSPPKADKKACASERSDSIVYSEI